MRRPVALVFCLWLVSPALAGADDARGYAVAFVTASLAEDRCFGMTMNKTGAALLRMRAVIDDRDESVVASEIPRLRPILEVAYLKAGAKAWCGAAWRLFGPAGGINLIRRD